MAWTRTATSLISFGFTIYTFFSKERGTVPESPLNYVTFSMMMMSTGLVSLALATYRYHTDMAKLRDGFGAEPRRTAEMIAAVIALLGFLGVVTVIVRS